MNIPPKPLLDLIHAVKTMSEFIKSLFLNLQNTFIMKRNWLFIAVIALLATMYSCQDDLETVSQAAETIQQQAHDHRTCGNEAHMNNLMSNPEYREERAERLLNFEEEKSKVEIRALCNDPVIIPVAVHYQGVSSPNSSCLISLAQSQIDILNDDFQGKNADISSWQNVASSFNGIANGETCIKFVLADQNHPSGYGLNNGDLAVTINKTTGDQVNQWSGYINFFVQPNTGLLGYSPLGGAGNGDGVVIDAAAFGSGSGCGSVAPSAPYNLGRTLTHELGHFLNLDHIWGNAGCGGGDSVNDTPNQDDENYGCPTIPQSSCGSNDLSMNYMDYTNDACMFMFSAGQSTRMENWVSSNLTNVTNNANNVISGSNGGGNGTGGGDPAETCETPSEVSATATSTSSIKVSWLAQPEAIKYRIRYKVQGSTSWSYKTVTSTNKTITGLVANTTYIYQVRTRCPQGWTPYSSQKTVLTQNTTGGGGGSNLNTVKLKLKLDDYPEETSWELEDSNGEIINSGGPYGVNQANKLKSKTFSLEDGEYTLFVDDLYGDGICCDYGNGYVKLNDVNNSTFANDNGNFGYYTQIDFSVYNNVATFQANNKDQKATNAQAKTRGESN